jgi:hypothetical protein
MTAELALRGHAPDDARTQKLYYRIAKRLYRGENLPPSPRCLFVVAGLRMPNLSAAPYVGSAGRKLHKNWPSWKSSWNFCLCLKQKAAPMWNRKEMIYET